MAGKYPSPHSYILLEDKHRLHPRGSLLRLKKNGVYESRNHLFSLTPRSEGNSFDKDVASLALEEFHLLDAIISPSTRYTVYSTPGKLAWGVGLKVGDTVLAKLPPISGRVSPSSFESAPEAPEFSMAVIRWMGVVSWWKKHMFGVEILEEQYFGRGDTDGTYHYTFSNDQRLFDCKDKHGLFLTLDKMEMPPSLQAITSHLQDSVLKLEGELKTRTQQVQELAKSESKLQGEVSQLQEEAKENRRVIVHSQGQVVVKENLIAQLQDELRTAAEWEDLEDSEAEEGNGLQQDQLNAAELEATRIIQEELEQMGEQVMKWQGEAKKKDAEIAQYEEELRAARELVQEEVAERANVIEKWEGELKVIYEHVAKLGEELKAARTREKIAAKWKADIMKKDREIADLRRELSSARANQDLLQKLLVDSENVAFEWMIETRKREDILSELLNEKRDPCSFRLISDHTPGVGGAYSGCGRSDASSRSSLVATASFTPLCPANSHSNRRSSKDCLLSESRPKPSRAIAVARKPCGER